MTMNEEEFFLKYGIYEGKSELDFTHIKEASCYNSNYFIGLQRERQAKKDILYCKSNDDNIIEWFVINEWATPIFIGYEDAIEGKIILSQKRL